jgi:hypothetical protein
MIKIFTIGILLFAGFRLLVLIARKITFSKKIRHHLNYILSILELIVWFSFLTWVIKLVYESKDRYILVFAAVAFILLLVPAFILLRDFIFGVFLKAQNKVVEGTFIDLGDMKGEIVKAGQFFLNIEEKPGNIKSLGYYKVHSRVISISGDKHQLERLVLEFNFPVSNRINELIERLNYQLLNTPWIAASKAPVVESINTEGKITVIRMAVFVINISYRENIMEMVNQKLALAD